MSKSNERTAVFGHVNERTVSRDVQEQIAEADTFPAGRIVDGVPHFTTMDDYTTYRAEWALKDRDVVIHFFRGEDTRGWTDLFPSVLDRVAREHFDADAPRLQAKFTQEMDSWWFLAKGYNHVLNLPAFLGRFFEKLDAGLEEGVQ